MRPGTRLEAGIGLAVIAAVASVLLGLLVVADSRIALAAIAAMVFLMLTRADTRLVVLGALAFVLAVPTGWSMGSALPFLSVPVAGASVSAQMMLIVLASGFYVVALVGSVVTRRPVDAPEKALAGAAVLWLIVVAWSCIRGVSQYGLNSALLDVQPYAAYILLLTPLFGAGRGGDSDGTDVLRALLGGLALYCLWVMALLMIGPLHDAVYAGTAVSRYRVGFASTSLLVAYAPLVLASLESAENKGWARAGLIVLLILMGLTVLASQSRASVAAATAAILTYLLASGRMRSRGEGSARSFAGFAVAAILALAVVSVSPEASSVVSDFRNRSSISVTDTSYVTRAMTYDRLFSSLMSDGSWVTGRGMGSTAAVVAPSGAVAYTSYSVDSAFLTVLLKSGVVGVLSLVLMILSMWAYSIRLALRGSARARAVATSLPFLVLVAGVPTAHLVNALSVPAGLAGLMAVLVVEARRLGRASVAGAGPTGEADDEVR